MSVLEGTKQTVQLISGNLAVGKVIEIPAGFDTLYMAVVDDFIQISSDKKEWTEVVALADLKGDRGDMGVGIAEIKTDMSSEDDGANFVQINLTGEDANGYSSYFFTIKNGSKGSTGAKGVDGTKIHLIDSEPEMESEQSGYYDVGIFAGAKGDLVLTASYNLYKVTEYLASFRYNVDFVGNIKGAPGAAGSDASVTSANIEKALGYTPANSEGLATEDYVKEYAQPKGNYLTEHQSLAGYATLKDIPLSLSELQNDSGFITKAVNDLTNYYLKTETYTQAEINALVSAIPKFSIEVVSSLPTTGISATTVYLLKSGDESQNLYTEYIYVNGAWEYLGKQTVDLTGYALKSDIPTDYAKSDHEHSQYLTSVPSEYVTETELNAKGYLTQHQDLSAYAKTSQLPTKTSQLANDSNFLTSVPSEYVTETELNAKGYLTGYTETDPTVPAWAKASTKPTYTATEVGAVPTSKQLTMVGIDENGETHTWIIFGEVTTNEPA